MDRPSDALRRRIDGWADVWGVPGLEARVDVSFSRRFRTSLGRCYPASREVRLAAFLLDGPDALLQETLCHELAHAAVYELHGRSARPHGREWRELMRVAGFEPRARVPAALLDGVAPALTRGAQKLWEHHCPVCRASHVARTSARRWRCAACFGAGRAGKLVIRRVGAASALGGSAPR